MNNRFQSALLLTLLLLTPLVGIAGADEVEPAPTCEILVDWEYDWALDDNCLLYTSPSPRDKRQSRMPSSA